uniref:Charged multivesicular body protein 3 n=1 Tax=Chlamydomonas leiostraca TaxID=1034604 RepID=A0A7S0RQB4_9CHLO|mmetsp:Transcript_28281/g.72117  ORF Transcript_28281/g.72117 Transcript_28281/m.72117 type:complete len:219 (+) Transcript_28281:121-777(+)|eukprot:CAMPEP_0202857562 /NCGR_PEP_ID=MMETSP1391-20130828/455_1 /ASSEMBLY_ACC=CAM_ASM_000867 /TAXON_ID=1034604 /ORGANISM="Chlamydomonas leiostraca, Strain SAG 11-49" /LENGTH=218 /DNA_ID=CAMNT_0049536375 /DNA_START=56 /DNA_END=712 /DNA_ORIENTATION=-
MQRVKEALGLEEDPKVMVRKWQATLRSEQRALDRQVRDIQFEEKKVVKSIREAAKRGDQASVRVLAKQVVHTRKTVGQLYTNKAQLMSINNQLVEQLAVLRVSHALQKSTQVMSALTQAIKLPELQRTMVEMSKEMMRAGLIDEMMSDTLDSAMDTEDMEEETEEEISKVLDSIIGDTVKAMPAAGKAKLPQQQAAEEEEEPDDMEELQSRLAAVKAQ